MKTALITGANKGIGFEIARQLGRQGFQVFLSGRNEEKMEKALAQLTKEGLQAVPLRMDVTDKKSILAAARQFSSHDIKLDVLVNNAAILLKTDARISSDADEIMEQTITTNCFGPLLVSKAFLPYLNNPALIVMISSSGGSMTDPVGGWSPAYCVSKTMLNSITRQLAYELQRRNIAVNAVCPGWVKTDMGGAGATRPVAKGAETPVWLATDAPQNLSGKFIRDKRVIDW